MKKKTLEEQKRLITEELFTDFNNGKIQAIDAINVAFERGVTIQKSLIPKQTITKKRYLPSKEEREEEKRIWELYDKRAEIKRLALELLKSPIWHQESSDVLVNIKKSIVTARQFDDLVNDLIN